MRGAEGAGWGGTGVERKQERETEKSARAEEKATMSREKGLIFKKVICFFYKKRTLP